MTELEQFLISNRINYETKDPIFLSVIGEELGDGDLWDFSSKDILTHAIELDKDMRYYLITYPCDYQRLYEGERR